MARVGPGRAGVSRQGRGRGRGRGRGGSGQRRPPTWEISDSDAEGPAGSEAAPRARDPAGERRAAAEALRLLRPEQVLKRLAVCVDPAILEDAGADVLMEALEALGCECRIEPQRPARSLRWTRASPDPCPRSLPPEVWAADEQEFLLLLEAEEFLQGVATLTQISGPTRWMPWISPETTARSHLAVIGLDAYLWSRQHTARGTQQPESPKVAGAEVAIGWPQVEEALVLLQLWANLDVLLVASWQELSQHVCAITKALAQCPLKQYRESQAFSFCTAGRWAAGEPVARDGTGLRGAWRRQIRQFSRVSPAVADAVVTAFPSPRLLQQALEACSTEQERMGLLADLPVLPSEGGRPRRVGPDLSRRICLFLTTANPDLLLDLGS
ncbi:probable crossover junction endonuclease EME2 isoform X2 [Chlorocebus sabaeus]|uniref:Structure-specific endonuclease subunit EME2 n=1 Tax=Chlorocebus sabaeus TaxID=60711 RepID=A0A0D9RG73_CHLSB